MRFRSLAICAAAAGLVACARHSNDPASLQQGQALLVVKNDLWLDANVFALRGASRQRIGTVSGFKTDTIPLRLTIVAGGGPVRLLAEPVGLNSRHVSEPIQVAAGEVVEFTIRDPLNLSSVIVLRP